MVITHLSVEHQVTPCSTCGPRKPRTLRPEPAESGGAGGVEKGSLCQWIDIYTMAKPSPHHSIKKKNSNSDPFHAGHLPL